MGWSSPRTRTVCSHVNLALADGLKEQATKWEVAIAQLNADLSSKLQILLLLSCPTYHDLFQHNLYADIYSCF
jgi:hypothetical protein